MDICRKITINILRMTVRITKLFVHTIKQITYKGLGMENENISPELGFFQKIFQPDKWETYFRRTKLLSSPAPGKWELIDFPLEVALELTNYCNINCIMCPVPNLKRSRGFMDEGVFKKVAEDISQESGFLFMPQGFGELFLNNKWSQLIDFASNRGIQPIIILTNGMLLNETNIPKLINKVDVILVTIDGATAKTYESVRVKGNFEKVTKNIEKFLEIRGNNESPHLVLRIIKMKETGGEIASFHEYWSKKIEKGDIIHIADYNDWAGSVTERGIDEIKTQKDRRPCRMLWKNLTVYYDGRVSPCCYDAEGDLIIGNVSNQGLKEIWNGAPLRNMRNLHLTHQFGKIPLCSRCRNWI